MDLKAVELFRTGRWNEIKTFTRADLDAMVDSFDALRLAGRVPLKFGHNESQPLTDGQPALGWIERVYREGDVLKGDFTDVPRVVYDAIKSASYKFVSVELLRDVAANDREYPWVLSAVALLGADIPAVSGLQELRALTHSRRAGFPTGTLMTFTTGGRETMNETEKLQAEVKRLNSQLVKNAFDTAIRDKRILPRDREAFERRMGATATLEEAERWIAASPKPDLFSQPRSGRGHDSRDDRMPEGDSPDAELVGLAQKAVENSGGTLTYFAAQQKVLRANPDLAERYRLQPGTRE